MIAGNKAPLSSPGVQLMAIEVISELLVTTSPHKLGEKLTEHLRELSCARTVIVLAHHPEPARDELLNASPPRRATLFSPDELNLLCFEKTPCEIPILTERLPADHPLYGPLLRAGTRSMVRHPLRAAGELVGMLLLFDLPGIERISETNHIIQLLAPTIAFALKNALAYRLIEHQAQELEQRVEERTAELQLKNIELQSSDTRHRTMLHTAMDGFWLVDLEGRLVEVNDIYCQMSGYSRQELLTMRVTDLECVETADDTAAHLGKVLALGQDRFESKHRRKDGSLFDVEVSVMFQATGSGQLITFLRDITDHKTIETFKDITRDILQCLNKSDDLQNTLHEILTLLKARIGLDAVGIRLQKGDDYPYLSAVGFPEDLLLKENSLIERTANGGVCRGQDGNSRLECACRLVITGNIEPGHPFFTQGGSFWTNDSFPRLILPAEVDPRNHPRNECIHHNYASVALVPIRDNQTIVGLLQFNDQQKNRFTLKTVEPMEDIAGHIGVALMRKKAEEQLRRSEYRLAEAERIGNAGSWDYELTSDTASWSENMFRIFDVDPLKPKELAFKHFVQHSVHPDDVEHILSVFQDALAGKSPYDVEYRVVRRDGSIRNIHAIAKTIRDEQGKVIHLIGRAEDITERLRAEEERARLESLLHQAQKMESVGSLAGGVAHDFNNKLTVIIGHACLALTDTDLNKIHGNLEEIRKAAEQSADLTRQLLAFARKQAIAPKVLDLNETVASMLKMLHRLLGEDISLTWRPAPDLWLIKFDSSQLDQILANLCVNARDSIGVDCKIIIESGNSTIGGGHSANADIVPGEYVRLVVSDNGCGMGKEILDRIFEPFFTTKETGKGTGLGLATVYGIVKQNNGFINVYSEPGSGTTFSIYLPRRAGLSAPAPKDGLSEPTPQGHETVLLVEDELAILEMTTLILTGQGYTVLKANTPAEAIRLASKHADGIDLLLTDVIMPEMNGKDLASYLRSVYPQLTCLFMSGYTDDAIAHHGILDDGVHFIQKPFSLPSLATKVREVLDAKQAEEQTKVP